MDEKGDDAVGMDDTTDIDNAGEEENEGRDTAGHDVQKFGQEDHCPKKSETKKKATDRSVLYPVQIAGSISPQGMKAVAAMADKPAQKVSLREKLEAYRAQVAGMGKQGIEKAKGKEEML